MVNDCIQGDRRVRRRYPMELDLDYKIMEGAEVVAAGAGKTSNISSGGLLFCPANPVARGPLVELSIRWPAVLGDAPFIQLFVSGRVVRSDSDGIAVQMSRYAFQKLGDACSSFHRLFDSALIQ
jgi:PilZ domain